MRVHQPRIDMIVKAGAEGKAAAFTIQPPERIDCTRIFLYRKLKLAGYQCASTIVGNVLTIWIEQP